jgi:pyrroloquinoline quinone biosynthesis protein E
MMLRPYSLLAELTYQCPLHCPYCSNPTSTIPGSELSTEEWVRVLREAAALGILQAGFSGGEPLTRPDLADLVAAAREAGLYTNLITSGVGLTPERARALRQAGLDAIQISFQAENAASGDALAGTRAHEQKLNAARAACDAGLPLGLNIVLHRENIDRLEALIALAEVLEAERLELAHTQYYGWALLNRRRLLPSRTQVEKAAGIAQAAQQRLAGKMEIFYVLPDYYEDRPKPCMQGWGRRFLTVNPGGQVLPCPNALSIPGLAYENVRQKSLEWIWTESESFNRFRGTAWMPEPCRECPQREIDFGGCRCQAALLTGDPAATDPVCGLSPQHHRIETIISAPTDVNTPSWRPRQNPRLLRQQ